MKRALFLWMLTISLTACAAPPMGSRSVDEVRTSGSLRGTDLDGAWAAPGKRREAEAQLLRRFDHLLTAIGETGLPELRRYIEREVTREHGAAAAQEALAAWDEHLAVLRGEPPTQLPNNPAPEPPPRTPKRPTTAPRALLIPDKPATEADAQALHAQRVSQFGTAAAERLRLQDLARWDWARRLAAARQTLDALAAAPKLSAAQRLQAQEGHLAQHFSGGELQRARALLLKER